MAMGLGYSFETMLKLFEEVPSICAIKDWCNDPMMHERHIRTFQSLDRPVNILTTHMKLPEAELLRLEEALEMAGVSSEGAL